ncbi:MAG TPA: GTP cyclohydrolase II [Chloroflexota bacterium]|nr:GTP cyclohydrolase II [Chloroflexota bacterium]
MREGRISKNLPNGHLPFRLTTASTPTEGLPETSIRRIGPGTVECVVTTSLPTRYGRFRISAYRANDSEVEHLALSFGDISELGNHQPVLVRLHSECLTGDVFGSARCDCGDQLSAGMKIIASAGRGILLYLRQEGRGIGLANKLLAYAMQDQGLDTVDANAALGFPADRREYGSAASILLHMGVTDVRLITNNPAKVQGLEAHGVRVVERIGIEVPPNPTNLAYLRTKALRMGHLLSLVDDPQAIEPDRHRNVQAANELPDERS